jgi:hypothetical protein
MEKKYTIQISDNTGHTELLDQTVDNAVKAVIEKVESHNHWVWVDGQLFEFEQGEVGSNANAKKLAARLAEANNPTVVLTGTLVGGLV